MEFGLFYFANDSNATTADRYELVLSGARFADANGFASVWTPERHFHPFGGLYPAPAVVGAAIAAVTERVQIRAGSVVAPLHHPLRIAEEWSVVDNLSNGRVGVSFASGWHAADFALSPANYADRRQLLLDDVELVRRLWRGETISCLDGAGAEQQLGVFPAPVRPELPVWVTSAGSIETFRNAGRIGAGLLTHLLGQDIGELRAKIGAYRDAVATRPDAGDWPGHVVLMVHTYLDADEDTARAAVRAPLCDYLRSSLDLVLGSQPNGGPRIDPAKLAPEDVDFLVERAFDRYFTDGGLLGTVEKAQRIVRRFAELGVDEIACLIDFGLPTETVLAGLTRLAELRDACTETAMSVR